jgi:hypothetical protein
MLLCSLNWRNSGRMAESAMLKVVQKGKTSGRNLREARPTMPITRASVIFIASCKVMANQPKNFSPEQRNASGPHAPPWRFCCCERSGPSNTQSPMRGRGGRLRRNGRDPSYSYPHHSRFRFHDVIFGYQR